MSNNIIPDTIRIINCETPFNIMKLFDDDLLSVSAKFKNLFMHGVIKIKQNGYYSRYKMMY